MSIDALFGLPGKTALILGDGKVPYAIAAIFREAGAAVAHVAEPVLDETSVADLFAVLPALDILVNGVVRTGPWPIEMLSMAEWDRVQEVNLRRAFLLMREAVRTMRVHGRGGRHISISTIGAVHPVLNGNLAFGSSRAGTNALMRQFALDFASEGILSNVLLLGAIASDPFPRTRRCRRRDG
jgi:meso-butanediol dehydrogenase / (S,S)-butanediol dehydrogenase / diacetyl reductase